jgi:hypothetical protein
MSEQPNFEAILQRALAPVEPRADFAARLEGTLVDLTALAADELESWELRSMRDPRNWVRPAAAVVVGTTAGAALVLLRARRQRRQPAGPRGFTERAAREVAGAARGLIERGSDVV